MPSTRKQVPSITTASTSTSTPITLNIYDLLPPSRLSSLLWLLGTNLHHSGLVLHGREYAYGGHSSPGKTGVWHTAPGLEPPGGKFRCSIVQGYTDKSEEEIDKVVKKISAEFLGTKYNLLTNNCNHFTSALSGALCGRPGPKWINRAAGVGLALPCVVPREWISPPEVDDMEGELVGEVEGYAESSDDERATMLDFDRRRTPPPRVVKLGEGRSKGREVRAAVPRRMSLGD